MKACCFGHREQYRDIDKQLDDYIEYLITNNCVDIFYVGGMGETDSKFSSANPVPRHRQFPMLSNFMERSPV